MSSPKRDSRPVAVAFVLFFVSSWRLGVEASSIYPPYLRTVEARFAAQDAGIVLLGARRVGASLAFIQTLQYYAHPWMVAMDAQSAAPGLLTYGRRMLSLNPLHRYGVQYVAGVLGFNNGTRRIPEALQLLKEASTVDPSYWRYRALAGAIAYQQDARNQEAADLLEAAVDSPECPSMIKNILAGLHKKAGRIPRAVELYEELLMARDRNYADRAREALEEIRRETASGGRP
jgi:tetratricopeptide (TPR) repeat protein